MTRDDGGPVFPQPDRSADPDAPDDERGLSLRDYFAASALVAHGAILAAQLESLDGAGDIAPDIARVCYRIADAMLKARQS